MKVKITKPDVWYTNRVGEVYEVEPRVGTSIYEISKGSFKGNGIDIHHCEVIEEEVVTTTKANILAAAASCSQVKAALQKLYPEVFEDELIPLPYLKDHRCDGYFLIGSSTEKNKYVLSTAFKWEIVENYLVVTKKYK